MMNALGECIGALGMIPCCPCPNPFHNVSQGAVGLVSRFGQFYKVRRPYYDQSSAYFDHSPSTPVWSRSMSALKMLESSVSRLIKGWFARGGSGKLTIFADVKIQLTSVPRQTVQTKDNVSVEVDSVICWHGK